MGGSKIPRPEPNVKKKTAENFPKISLPFLILDDAYGNVRAVRHTLYKRPPDPLPMILF